MSNRKTKMDRRSFLHVAAAAGAAALLPARALAAPKRRPNVILIFSDDQGTLDINCFGSDDLYTPHLDALARRGVRFTQFYAGAPVCSPSRAALLTGRYPQRAGVPGNVSSEPGNPGMPPEQVTIAEVLRKAGYRTAIFGKWHLGTNPDCDPLGQGFHEFFGHKGGCIDNYSHFFYWHGPNRHDLWRNRTEVYEGGKFFPDLIVREVSRFLDANKDRPFFLYLPFNVPHYPEQGEEEYRKMYAKLPMPRRSYAAFISTMDEKIGKIVAKVDELGLRDNTLLVFLSDHGYSTEVRAFGGGGNAGPYRGSKFSLFEGGVRVPCIASMPGTIPEDQARHSLATSLDWYPTIAELCGAKLPERKIDGRSLWPLLKSDAPGPAHKVFHWETRGQWAVREGDWKLVVHTAKQGESLMLSDMSKDVSEQKSLHMQHPEIVERFRKLHRDWVNDVKDRS